MQFKLNPPGVPALSLPGGVCITLAATYLLPRSRCQYVLASKTDWSKS